MQVGNAFTIFSKTSLAYFLGQVSDAKASSERCHMLNKNPDQIAHDFNALILCSFSQVKLIIFFSLLLCLSSLKN